MICRSDYYFTFTLKNTAGQYSDYLISSPNIPSIVTFIIPYAGEYMTYEYMTYITYCVAEANRFF